MSTSSIGRLLVESGGTDLGDKAQRAHHHHHYRTTAPGVSRSRCCSKRRSRALKQACRRREAGITSRSRTWPEFSPLPADAPCRRDTPRATRPMRFRVTAGPRLPEELPDVSLSLRKAHQDHAQVAVESQLYDTQRADRPFGVLRVTRIRRRASRRGADTIDVPNTPSSVLPSASALGATSTRRGRRRQHRQPRCHRPRQR